MFFMVHLSATRCPPLSRTVPLGSPVVPDVYRMYRGSVAATGTQSWGSAPAIRSSQSTSRPAIMCALAWGRCTMMHFSGLCRAISMAPSSNGLYSMMRSTSMPQDAETIAFGWASSMRVASSLLANPPKTTECTAPMRAHASMAITASGTMGI